jgi:putative flippase GtrA
LEILVRHPELRVAEIPFEFGNRHAGESKASTKEVARLMRHMFKLRMLSLKHLGRFLAVGASGLIVNNVLMALFVELFGLHYLTSAIFATQGSTLWNFSGTELWVFKDRPQQQGHLWRRLVSFLLLSNVMLMMRGPMLAVFVSGLGMHYLAANLLSITLMTLLRYAVADRLIWRNGKGEMMKSQKEYNYNIHDLIRVRSMQRLPELTYPISLIRRTGRPTARTALPSREARSFRMGCGRHPTTALICTPTMCLAKSIS